MKIVICDDEEIQRKNIIDMCKKWALDREELLQVIEFSSAEEFLFSYEEKKDYDVVLLDINMGKENGIGLAKKLRSLEDDVPIIFITGIVEHVFEGYKVQALDYILKPVKELKLFEALDRARKYAKEDMYLLVDSTDGVVKVKLSEVRYIESQKHDTIVVTKQNKIISKKGISKWLEELGQMEEFFQCHRSFLLHIGHIQVITKSEVKMDNQCTIPIARGKWEALNLSYLKYYRNILGGQK